MKPADVHSIEVEFIVDTGAAMLCLPPEVIDALDLYVTHTRRVLTGNGEVTRRVYSPVRITIFDREANLDVMELPPDTPPVLGYLVLEALDLYPNSIKQCLEGNPKYGGKMVMDLLGLFSTREFSPFFLFSPHPVSTKLQPIPIRGMPGVVSLRLKPWVNL